VSETRLGYTPDRLPESQRRARMRERGYSDGLQGKAKASTEQEYLTSYRRGRERRERQT
jgi:hypothetical protein